MHRTDLMAHLMRLARLSARCDRTGEGADEAVEREAPSDASRRRFAKGVMAGAATVSASVLAPPIAVAGTSLLNRLGFGSGGGVAVVGAGLAGLACAYELRRLGVPCKVFEAGTRVGGRCASLRGTFPGQVAELGAEFIGGSHHTMLGYAREFGLQLEDVTQFPGSAYRMFGSQQYSDAQLLEEYRGFEEEIRADLGSLSFPTADRHNEDDALYDFMTLDEYLQLQGTGGVVREFIAAAAAAEFGAGINEISALSFLRFVYGDRRGKFASPTAAEASMFHVVDGNDRIATGLASRLSSPVQLGHRLVAARKLGGGRVRLTFDIGGRSVQSDHDAVVFAMPFSVLRYVHLDASLGLPQWKSMAIEQASMGDNSKLMVGFNEAYWHSRLGASGAGFSNLPSMQSTWETNPSNRNPTRAVLTSLSSGARARLVGTNVQADATFFLSDLDRVLPGALGAARRNEKGQLVAHAHNWSIDPLSRGSYACHRPGYFTTIAHNEAKPVDNVLFAGDHTSSFYEWQGFMEGAALSGLRAANEARRLLQT